MMRVGAAAASAFAATGAEQEQEVYVSRRGVAKVVERIVDSDDGDERLLQERPHSYAGRIRVRFADGSGEYHVKPGKCTPILPRTPDTGFGTQEQYLIVCEDTETYRKIARTQLTQDDSALEIGSSCGVGTNVMSECCRRAIGIEISFAEVELARHRYPHIPFEHFDCFEYKERLLELTTQSTCVFVDINGNRELESVVELTNIVMGSRGIRLLVVKSKTLMRSLMLQFPNEEEEQHKAEAAAAVSMSRRLKRAKPKGCQAHADYIRRHGSGGFMFLDAWTPWWTHLSTHIKSSNLKNSRRIEAPSAPGRFLHYPLTYPMRYTDLGMGICRFYNYHRDGCLKGDACQYDHETCHYCGKAGHRALGCPAVQGTISSGGSGGGGKATRIGTEDE